MDGKNRLTCMIFGRKIPCGNRNFHRGFCFMNTSDSNFFGTEKVSRILLKIAPPVMLAQLIQALYNIVDSLFVAKMSENAMTALSLVFPIQNLISSIMIGFGIGINAVVSFYLGAGDRKRADKAASQGLFLGTVHGLVFTVIGITVMPWFLRMFTDDSEILSLGVQLSLIHISEPTRH